MHAVSHNQNRARLRCFGMNPHLTTSIAAALLVIPGTKSLSLGALPSRAGRGASIWGGLRASHQ